MRTNPCLSLLPALLVSLVAACGGAAPADGDYLPADYVPAWSDLTGVPADLADGDDVDGYDIGDGLNLDGGTLEADRSTVERWATGVCFDTEEELRALLDDDYLAAAWSPAWTDLTGVPAGLADGDNDTTYAAGDGLVLDGGTFVVDRSTVEGWATGVCFDAEAELHAVLADDYLPAGWSPDWSDLTGVPGDLADGDDDTTYTAGDGLTLRDGAFSVVRATIEAWATEAVELAGSYVPQPPSGVFQPTRSTIARDCDATVIAYVDPQGQRDEVDVAGMIDGEVRSGAAGLMHFEWNGAYGSALLLDISSAPGRACTFLHYDDDHPLPGWYYATDVNRSNPGLWTGTRAVFELRREGATDSLIPECGMYVIACF